AMRASASAASPHARKTTPAVEEQYAPPRTGRLSKSSPRDPRAGFRLRTAARTNHPPTRASLFFVFMASLLSRGMVPGGEGLVYWRDVVRSPDSRGKRVIPMSYDKRKAAGGRRPL